MASLRLDLDQPFLVEWLDEEGRNKNSFSTVSTLTWSLGAGLKTCEAADKELDVISTTNGEVGGE